jgi:hypothetical protein
MTRNDPTKTKAPPSELGASKPQKPLKGHLDRLRERLKSKLEKLKRDDPNVYPIH